MRFEYAILGLVAIFSFVLLVSAVYPDSWTANAITPSLSKDKMVVTAQQEELRESPPDILNRVILSDIANLKDAVSELNSRLGQAETCCQEAKQGTRALENKLTQLEQRITQQNLENRLNQLEQRVTQQERAGEQEAPAQSATDMFSQCQAFGTGARSDNCNAACIQIRKACAFAIQETENRLTSTYEYRFAACSETNYMDDRTYTRYSCMCC